MILQRLDKSIFLDNLKIQRRGTVKIANSILAIKKDLANNIQKFFKNFEDSPDIPKKTIEQYKKKTLYSDEPERVIKDFIKNLNKTRVDKKQMSLITAKSLRKSGIFKFSCRGVYEDLETGDFWQISSDKKHVIRLFIEDDKGIADKIA